MSQSTNKHSSGFIPSASVKMFLSYPPTTTEPLYLLINLAVIKPSTSGDIISCFEYERVSNILDLII